MLDFNDAGSQDEVYIINESVSFQPSYNFTFDPGAVVDAILEDIPSAEITPSMIIPDGRFHRFSTEGDQRGETSGFVKTFPDGIGAVYGCNRDGTRGVYQAWKPTTPQEKVEWAARVKAAHEEADRLQQEDWAKCREKSLRIGNNSKPADPDHAYLVRKGIQDAAEGLGLVQDKYGNLLIPVMDHEVTVHGLQFIPPEEGKKKNFLTGTNKRGHFFIIGEIEGAQVLLFAEGFGTAWSIHKAVGLPVVVCFDAGNLKPVIESFHKVAPDVKKIICADDDWKRINKQTGKLENIGIIKAKEAARAVNGLVAVPSFSGVRGDKDTDFNDLMRLEGIEAVRAQVEKVVNQKHSQRGKFQLVRFGEMKLRNISWLIKGYLEADSVALVIGDPGSGKSFFVIDWICRIATGTDFYGGKVKQGAVVYIAGEGNNGVFRRFAAWAIRNSINLESAPLYISNMPAQLTDQEQSQFLCQEIEKAEKDAGHIALIVIDTLARNFGAGDENSAKDMGQFVAECDSLKALYGSTVLIVHHTGIADKSRARGSSSLKGAVDAEFKVERYAKDKNLIMLTCTKMKDAEHPEPLAFNLKTVDLNMIDEDGEPVTSAILDPAIFPAEAEILDKEKEARQKKRRMAGAGRNQKQLLFMLKQLYNEHQKNLEEGDYDPDQAKVKFEDWKDLCLKSMDYGRFWDAKNGLIRSGIITVDEHYVYPESEEF